MKLTTSGLRLAATDLANHLACRHLSHLDLQLAHGLRQKPKSYRADVAILQERGAEHEAAFLRHLEAQGRKITRLADRPDEGGAFEQTLGAMRDGADVIVQATLLDGDWYGRADVLLRVEKPSRLGDWSYEVWDTKLARETKAGSVLQICLYSDLLETVQGVRPEFMYVVPPRQDFAPDIYRVDEFLAYYRLVRRRLEGVIDEAPDGDGPGTYPEPVPHCDVCRWWSTCDKQRHDDDHLSLVAGIAKLQRRELESHDVETLTSLAEVPLPIPWRPSRGAVEGYTRVREQARVQLDGRRAQKPIHELLPLAPGAGLMRLPEPSPGDVFFDLEGDPYVEDGGREYLFGWAIEGEGGAPVYTCTWAMDRAAERDSFEAFLDLVMERWRVHPGMHIYHYAAYEPGAIKRLMGRYASRENEVDRLLRAGVFVDLHAVVKQTLRASVEEYSIKKMEAHYGFTREAELRYASENLRAIERALERGQAHDVDETVKQVVATYNRDDCVSTLHLRRWLEQIRAEEVTKGAEIPRPPVGGEGEASEAITERDLEVKALIARLLHEVPLDDRNEEQQARWLLAYLLEWHRREEKASWWEFFRLRGLPDDELLDESAGLAGLQYVGTIGSMKNSLVDRYSFPLQETSIRAGQELKATPEGVPFGEVVAIDLTLRTIDVKKGPSRGNLHPTGVFMNKVIVAAAQAASLLRLAHWVADHGVDAPGPHRAARDLLLGRPPRIRGHAGGPLRHDGENGVDAARRLALAIEHGTLAIQGPPGTGKTFTGARMICDLVRAGKRVGVCAFSHKVIRNLLDAVVEAARELGVDIQCFQKDKDDEVENSSAVAFVKDNAGALQVVQAGPRNVLGGTAWLWSREEFVDSVDVLFVDEAGQMSLANVLAIAPCADSVVLLGDPQQLDQPLKGTHPPGCEISALEHVLGEGKTIANERGLFLDETWRLPKPICDLTSELFYEGRLSSYKELARVGIHGPSPVQGVGLWYVPVAHDANTNASREEVKAVATLYERLTTSGLMWRDRDGMEEAIGSDQVLIIAPYNAQVADLSTRLPGARVGTVDRFQGQEAPIVIYSMTTSSPEDAPRGMEFLYSLNRFNVATSRAQCACIVVGNPRLFEPECRNPRQMQLANACCRYVELAHELHVEDFGGLEQGELALF
jgi:uncharacterized protein